MELFKEGFVMNKKVLKAITVLLMLTAIVFAAVTPVLGAVDAPNPSSSYEQGDTSDAKKAAENIVGALIDIFQVVGVGVAIIMLVMLAIKYLSAAPNEKAEIKKSVSIYVLGAVLLFAASGVLEIVQQFAANVGKYGDNGGTSGGNGGGAGA
jgi:hypothetical protein